MRIRSHSELYKALEKKADIINNKVPVLQLPNNIIHNGVSGLSVIGETPTIDADGVTLRFTAPHNLTVGQPIIIEENGGVVPIGIRDKNFGNAIFSQLKDKRLYFVYSVPTSNTIKVSAGLASANTSFPEILNRTIEVMGGVEFSASPSLFSIDKDSLDNIYVAFYDTVNGGKCSVRKFNGIGWSTVGNAGFTSNPAFNITIAVAQDNTLYVTYKDSNTSKCVVMKFNGSAWVTVGASLPTTGNASYPTLCIYNNNPYIAFQDSNQSSKCIVMKFDGSSWINVGTNPVSDGAATYINLKIATNGDIFVAYADGSVTSKVTVKKFDGATWSIVGTLGFTTTAANSLSLVLSADNTPYIAYANSATQGMVRDIDYVVDYESNCGDYYENYHTAGLSCKSEGVTFGDMASKTPNATYDYRDPLAWWQCYDKTVYPASCTVNDANPIKIDFGTAKPSNTMKIDILTVPTGQIANLKIQYSSDATTWTDVPSLTRTNQVWKWAETSARYFKVFIPSYSWTYSLYYQNFGNVRDGQYSNSSNPTISGMGSTFFLGKTVPGLKFTTPPPAGASIDATYSIEYPFKTANNLLRFTYSIVLQRG